jgi:hypothetical protein
MKKLAIAALLFGVAAGPAFAQSCGTPGGPASITPFNASGDTCAGGATDEFGAVCGGGIISGGPSDVYRVNVGTPNNFTIVVTPSGGYDAAIYLVGPGTCAQTTGCPAGGDADNAGNNGAETIGPLSGLAVGTYFLVVDSTNLGAAAPACGPYTVAITSTLPVGLKNFSVD